MLPPFDIKDVIYGPHFFQNKAKISLRQVSLAIYILCKSDIASCNILSFRTYCDSRTIGYGCYIVFNMRTNFYRHAFTAINILRKFGDDIFINE